jgi:hypothetical protein
VTNGDCAADRIAGANTGGEVLPWRDVLHEGPVPAGLDDRGLRAARAEFLGGDAADRARVLAGLEERDASLDSAAAASGGEIVLWFEPDLYDQLQLLQVLERLSRSEPKGVEVTAVESVAAIGDLDPAAIRELHAARSSLPADATELAALAWRRFRDPDPTRFEALAARSTPSLPHLAPAIGRHLEELPAVGDGLSRSERQALEALSRGPLPAREAFVAAHHAREERVFLGDLVFYSYLDRLASGEHPLVSLSAGPARADTVADLTDDGRRVLGGRADWIELGGADRWLGGVHLEGRDARWRWDPVAGRVVHLPTR